TYALPRRFGYGVVDYLRLLRLASTAIKDVESRIRVIGGIGAAPRAGLTHEFIEQGGLRWVDVLDLHLYEAPRAAESYEEDFRELEQLMQAHGGPKPMWITEWGCYADDDPACDPPTVGDAAMNRCRWPTERAASEHIVKFATVALAHGVERIFFHAGTCGAINQPDAGGVLFEYGGAPRKMYPAVAVFTRLVGVPGRLAGRVERDGWVAFVFETSEGATAVLWAVDGRTHEFEGGRGIQWLDLMGNVLSGGRLRLGGTPVYVRAANPAELLACLEARAPARP
ncbi:MAG: hypothetical protein D6766_04725, partial [Verrucomicrobia bacterium]